MVTQRPHARHAERVRHRLFPRLTSDAPRVAKPRRGVRYVRAQGGDGAGRTTNSGWYFDTLPCPVPVERYMVFSDGSGWNRTNAVWDKWVYARCRVRGRCLRRGCEMRVFEMRCGLGCVLGAIVNYPAG